MAISLDTPTSENLLGDYAIYGDALYMFLTAQAQSPESLFYLLINFIGQVLIATYSSCTKNLGFDLPDTPEEADVVVLCTILDSLSVSPTIVTVLLCKD